MLNCDNPLLYARLSKQLFIAGLCFFTTFCERFLPDYLETTISSYIHIGAFSSLLIGASFALSMLFYGLSKYLQPTSSPDVLYFTQEWIVPNFITVDLGLDSSRRNYLNNYFRWPAFSLTSKAVFNLRLYPRGLDGLGEEISIHVQSCHRFEDNLQPLDAIFLVYLRDKKGDKCFEKGKLNSQHSELSNCLVFFSF